MTPQESHQLFHEDSARFLLAQNVILASELAARNGNEDLLQRFNRFKAAGQPTYKDLYEYLCVHLFVVYISNFETFLQNITTHVVKKHPKKLGNTQFKLSDVIDASDNSILIDRAIEEHLNKIMYKRPLEYLQDLCSLLSIKQEPIERNWAVFVEAKARRDLGVHSAWRCNAIYLRKIEEAGLKTTLTIGSSAIPDTDKYMDSVADALQDLAEHITNQVLAIHDEVVT